MAIEQLKDKQLLAAITLAALVAGTAVGNLTYDPDSTYYCESRDMVVECERLSSTGLTCYFGDTYRRCSEGWEEISEFIEVGAGADAVTVEANLKTWKCKTNGGKIGPYSECYAGASEAYLSELI